MGTDFRVEAAEAILSNPPMWRWVESCFAEGADGSERWVDTERLEKIRDAGVISHTEKLMLDVALNILEGEVGALVNLDNILSSFDDGNYLRFLRAITIVRMALKDSSTECGCCIPTTASLMNDLVVEIVAGETS